MKHYNIHETRTTSIDEMHHFTTCNVRLNVRDDYHGTYDFEESFIAVEQYIEKHSNSLESILDRYCFG